MTKDELLTLYESNTLLSEYEEKELKQKLLTEFGTFIVLCYSWALGYILTWGMKWVLTEVLLHRNTISVALEQIKYRSISDRITYGLALSRNFKTLGIGVFLLLIVIIILSMIDKYCYK